MTLYTSSDARAHLTLTRRLKSRSGKRLWMIDKIVESTLQYALPQREFLRPPGPSCLLGIRRWHLYGG